MNVPKMVIFNVLTILEILTFNLIHNVLKLGPWNICFPIGNYIICSESNIDTTFLISS